MQIPYIYNLELIACLSSFEQRRVKIKSKIKLPSKIKNKYTEKVIFLF